MIYFTTTKNDINSVLNDYPQLHASHHRNPRKLGLSSSIPRPPAYPQLVLVQRPLPAHRERAVRR